MTPADWIVLLLGAGTIAWINWYFFLAQRRTGTSPRQVPERQAWRTPWTF